MKQSVVFSTPGLIPIEAFTVFGMNAKPNSTNPFGFFGTGLKIAIAVCIRMGQEVVIWRGKDKYTFYTKKTDFRGKEFSKIRMKLEKFQPGSIFGIGKPQYHDLPFTTELGKHWELWQAFREFQTNTMDENGTTQLEFWEDNSQHAHDNRSLVMVSGQKFVDEFHDRDRNFLPEGLTVREGSERIQVLDKPSKHVYYRGVRVMDLKEEAQFTYNFLEHVELTEDRTAKYAFILEARICEHIMQSKDEDYLQRTVSNPRGYERSLGYRYVDATPSAEFMAVAPSSPVDAVKAIVKAKEAVASTCYITIKVPKSSVSDEELHQLTELCQSVWGSDTTVREGGI